MDKKEAMKILKDFHDKSALFSVRTALDTVIPELKIKENDKEDERIIKALIQLVNDYPSIDLFIKYDIHSYEIVEWLKKQGEQKLAWSEEDEEVHRKCICAMRASACGFPEEEKFVEQVDNWLKSIKERVQPQPKQE